MSKLLVVDIETAPLDDVEQYLGAIQAPANYTKPESIEKYIAEKTDEERQKAALDPDLCRVVAIAFQLQGETDVRGGLAKTEVEEKALLERFWAFVRKAQDPFKVRYCGFNILGFDIPVLLRRSMFLGVSAPHIRLGRYAYQAPDIVDLQLTLTMDRHEKFRMRSKDWWVKRLKLAGADDANKGSDVGALVGLGKWDEVLHHCKADVVKEVQMAQWLNIWE
jgi:predicted PolB exonuclease-like 3'-5' exonuclease